MGRFRGRVIRLLCCVMLPPAVKRQSKCVRVKYESAIEMLLRLFEICHIWNISRNSYCVKTIRCDDSCNWIFIFNSSMCPTHTPGHQQRVFTLRREGFAGVNASLSAFTRAGRAALRVRRTVNEWSLAHRRLDIDDKRVLSAGDWPWGGFPVKRFR